MVGLEVCPVTESSSMYRCSVPSSSIVRVMLSSQRLWPSWWSSSVGFIVGGPPSPTSWATPTLRPIPPPPPPRNGGVWRYSRCNSGNGPMSGITTQGVLMDDLTPTLTADEIAAEAGELLPDKEVFSLLDLFVNLDLALDLAAPVDLAVAANANIAAPIDAAVGANVLSIGSTAQALADQGTAITQHLSGNAIADAP